MALIKCPGCDGNISTTADACPKCGYKLTEEDLQKTLNTNKVLAKSSECKEEVSTIPAVCSNLDTQEHKQKAPSTKPWYKKWWVIALIAIVGFFTLIVILGLQNSSTTTEVNYSSPMEAAFAKGVKAFENKDYETAFEALEKAHSLGHPKAKGVLGLTVTAMGNVDEGFRLIEEEANEGSPSALVALSSWYLYGLYGLSKDIQGSHRLLIMAYDTGHWLPAAMLALRYSINNPKEPYYPLDFDKGLSYAKEAEARGAEGNFAGLVERVKTLREGERKAEAATIDIATLLTEYNTNGLAAERMYGKGKRIYVRGNMWIVGRDNGGDLFIVLDCLPQLGWRILNIKFALMEKEANIAAKLRSGQRVRIRGIVNEQQDGMLYVTSSTIDRIY